MQATAPMDSAEETEDNTAEVDLNIHATVGTRVANALKRRETREVDGNRTEVVFRVYREEAEEEEVITKEEEAPIT